MNHNVLNIGEFAFHAVMNLVGNRMTLCQWLVTIYLNLQINIDFIAKHSGTKHIHLVLLAGQQAHFPLQTWLTAPCLKQELEILGCSVIWLIFNSYIPNLRGGKSARFGDFVRFCGVSLWHQGQNGIFGTRAKRNKKAPRFSSCSRKNEGAKCHANFIHALRVWYQNGTVSPFLRPLSSPGDSKSLYFQGLFG